MDRFKRFAAERPLSFGLVITFVFILLVLISAIAVSAQWPGDTFGWYVGSTIGRLVAIVILLLTLSLLGWLQSAGFTRLGRWQTWLISLLALAFCIPLSAYAMTGSLAFSTPDLALAGFAALFILIHAFLEEVAFRGLILHDFVRVWGGTSRGLVKSVLVSSLLFGAYHIIYILGEPLPIVLVRIVVGFLLGVFLGALVLSGGSIYPAAFFHGVLNLAAYLNLTSNAAEGTTTSWLLLSLVMIPLAAAGFFLLRTVPQRSAVPKVA
jgi:membrane protease YdiL (CAAX protease family)